MNESEVTRRAGVTLIEMLVVVVIIAVFAAVVGPRLLNQGDKARVVAARQQIENYLRNSTARARLLAFGATTRRQSGVAI